jgi:hypothetical protein
MLVNSTVGRWLVLEFRVIIDILVLSHYSAYTFAEIGRNRSSAAANGSLAVVTTCDDWCEVCTCGQRAVEA